MTFVIYIGCINLYHSVFTQGRVDNSTWWCINISSLYIVTRGSKNRDRLQRHAIPSSYFLYFRVCQQPLIGSWKLPSWRIVIKPSHTERLREHVWMCSRCLLTWVRTADLTLPINYLTSPWGGTKIPTQQVQTTINKHERLMCGDKCTYIMVIRRNEKETNSI